MLLINYLNLIQLVWYLRVVSDLGMGCHGYGIYWLRIVLGTRCLVDELYLSLKTTEVHAKIIRVVCLFCVIIIIMIIIHVILLYLFLLT